MKTASAGSCGDAKTASAGACGASSAACGTMASFEIPENVTFTRIKVPGGVDFVFAGEGIADFADGCCGTGSKVLKAEGNTISMIHGGQYLVISVRGEQTDNTCDQKLQKMIQTATADAGSSPVNAG